jgi:tetratricopeptide (TPR) repeat protein
VNTDDVSSRAELDSRPYRALLVAVLALGAVLRAVHLVRMRGSPFFDALILDAREYDAWAQRIASGELIGPRAFWIDPLYAYVLGGVYAVLGHELMAPRVLNALLGLATAVIVAATARRALDSRIAGLTAASLVCLFVPAIHFESQIEKTALTVALMALAVQLFLLGSRRALAAAGAVLGLAVLARGNMLLLVPAGAAALWLGWDRVVQEPARERRVRAVLFAACALPIVSLATLHNALAAGELVVTTTNFGINLYIGNHDGNAHGSYEPPDFVRPSTQTEQPDFRAEAERRTGESLSDRALSSYWAGEALGVIASEPSHTAGLTLRKLHSIVHDDEIPDSEAVELFGHWSKVVSAPIVWFGQLIPLAVLGAVVAFRRRVVRVLTAIAVLYALSLLPFFVLARLRMPLVAPLAVLGGGAVSWLVTAVDARSYRELTRALAIPAVLAIVCFYQPTWMADRTRGGLAIGWHNLGSSLEQQGRVAEAENAFERAVAVDERAVPGALRWLGARYQGRGEHARAERAMRRVVELKPESASARAAWRGLFSAILQSGDTERGIAMLQEAVRTGPYDENLRYFLGHTMEQHASAQAMVDFYSAEAARDPKPQTSHYFWAVGLARLGDTKGALVQLERALEIDPAHEMSQHRIGMMLEQQGELQRALERYEEAARIHPDYREALASAARVAEQLGRSELASEYQRRAGIADPSSPRRYLHWARYLSQRGRNEAALAELERMLKEQPGDPEATALRDRILQGANGEEVAPPANRSRTLSDEQRARIASELGKAVEPGRITIVFDGRFESARTLAASLNEVVAGAGWRVTIERSSFGLKPGLLALAATHPAAPSAEVLHQALRATQLEVGLRTGYREYASEMRTQNPSWAGLSIADDEDLVLAIGGDL